MITGSGKWYCWSFSRVPMLRRMGTSIFMTRRVPSNGINEVSDTEMEMTRVGWSGTAAGVSMRARMATWHAHREWEEDVKPAMRESRLVMIQLEPRTRRRNWKEMKMKMKMKMKMRRVSALGTRPRQFDVRRPERYDHLFQVSRKHVSVRKSLMATHVAWCRAECEM